MECSFKVTHGFSVQFHRIPQESLGYSNRDWCRVCCNVPGNSDYLWQDLLGWKASTGEAELGGFIAAEGSSGQQQICSNGQTRNARKGPV